MDPQTPVLLFTLDGDGPDRRRAAAVGAAFHADKDSDFSALVTTIEQMLRPH
jgi:DNA-binding NarL/FixJ family response regulator